MITINEIAKEANVSIATVSRAINAPETVSALTLNRIQNAIEKMGYAPNKIARSLKSQASSLSGLSRRISPIPFS